MTDEGQDPKVGVIPMSYGASVLSWGRADPSLLVKDKQINFPGLGENWDLPQALDTV